MHAGVLGSGSGSCGIPGMYRPYPGSAVTWPFFEDHCPPEHGQHGLSPPGPARGRASSCSCTPSARPAAGGPGIGVHEHQVGVGTGQRARPFAWIQIPSIRAGASVIAWTSRPNLRLPSVDIGEHQRQQVLVVGGTERPDQRVLLHQGQILQQVGSMVGVDDVDDAACPGLSQMAAIRSGSRGHRSSRYSAGSLGF